MTRYIVCEQELRNGLSYVCRCRYRETHKQLTITTTDLKRYLDKHCWETD